MFSFKHVHVLPQELSKQPELEACLRSVPTLVPASVPASVPESVPASMEK